MFSHEVKITVSSDGDEKRLSLMKPGDFAWDPWRERAFRLTDIVRVRIPKERLDTGCPSLSPVAITTGNSSLRPTASFFASPEQLFFVAQRVAGSRYKRIAQVPALELVSNNPMAFDMAPPDEMIVPIVQDMVLARINGTNCILGDGETLRQHGYDAPISVQLH